MNNIIHGDCLEKLKTLEDNSVDAVVTDPPYGLSFMGKKWDYDVPSIEIWKECLRVLKPGGYLLAFAGTRTQHRMAVRIEDAGFEIRDMIAWVYGCLSEDTEILTEMGYKPLHKTTQYDRIMVYDIQKNIYQWERPQGWQVYRVHEDTAYRIQSDYTDQIVSRNHNCIIEREGKLVFKKAEELSEMEYMPVLSEDFYTLPKTERKLLLSKLLRKSKGLAQTLLGKWKREKTTRKGTGDGKKPSVERWSNLFQKERKLRKIQNQVCEMSKGISADGEEGWVCNGTSFDSGSIVGEMFRENPSSASYQSQSRGQQIGESDIVSIKQGAQDTRVARVTKIKYSGLIFCPTVSTGAFVARRNGKVFITGNSGFPKSLNIGKAVDKLQGNEREKIQYKARPETSGTMSGSSDTRPWIEESRKKGYHEVAGNIPVGEDAKQWEGWGTALKPALEPITVARKPLSEKTVAENCLKWGVGGINIDGCRVGTEKLRNEFAGNKDTGFTADDNRTDAGKGLYSGKKEGFTEVTGRFPANLLHDGSDEVVSLFPNSKAGKNKEQKGTGGIWSESSGLPCGPEYGDNGSAARFFYCAKASKSERNRGCEGLEEKTKTDEYAGRDTRCSICGKFFLSSTNPCECSEEEFGAKSTRIQNPTNKNNHPTVKPIALMEYLVKLVSREGAIVLDPFAGSGSTLIACKNLGRQYIGIEREEEYIKIINARLK